MKKAHPCIEANAEERTLLAFDGLYQNGYHYCYAAEKRQRRDELLKKKKNAFFFFVQKVFSSLHKIPIEPLIAD